MHTHAYRARYRAPRTARARASRSLSPSEKARVVRYHYMARKLVVDAVMAGRAPPAAARWLEQAWPGLERA